MYETCWPQVIDPGPSTLFTTYAATKMATALAIARQMMRTGGKTNSRRR